jgi:DnaK suppressor protein
MEHSSDGSEHAAAGVRALTDVVEHARAETERLIASLTRVWDNVVETSAMSADDDEHDPEGQTVAFERAQLRDALTRARSELADLDLAAERIRAGTYFTCERCGGPISAERLAARLSTRTCITCASTPTR